MRFKSHWDKYLHIIRIVAVNFIDRSSRILKRYSKSILNCNCLALGWREMVSFVGRLQSHRQAWAVRAISNERARLDIPILVAEVVRGLLNALARRVSNLRLAPVVRYGSSRPRDVVRDVNGEFGGRSDISPTTRVRSWIGLTTGRRTCQTISSTTRSYCSRVISMSGGMTPWTQLFHRPWALSRQPRPRHRLVRLQRSVTLTRTSCSPRSWEPTVFWCAGPRGNFRRKRRQQQQRRYQLCRRRERFLEIILPVVSFSPF